MRKFKFTPPPSMKGKESAILKYSAIVLMALGGANIVLSFGGFFDIPTTAWYVTEILGEADPTAMLITSAVFSIIIGIAEFVTGIFGYCRRQKRKKMQLCIILGAVCAALIAAAAIYRMIADSAENGLLSLIELAPVAVYLFGAVRWQSGK